jgi:sec-independent protein translocase protein TatB
VFGINPQELLVLLAVAALVLGPERLPQYAQQLSRLVRELRRMAQGATEQVRQELGPEFDDLDWRKLDPRQYDPRRIVREALADTWDPDDPLGMNGKPVSAGGPTPVTAGTTGTDGAAVAGAPVAVRTYADLGDRTPPYDRDAT